MSKAAIGDFPRVSHSQPASRLSGKERRISGERQTDSALEATKTIQNMCKTTAAKQASKDTRWHVDRKKNKQGRGVQWKEGKEDVEFSEAFVVKHLRKLSITHRKHCNPLSIKHKATQHNSRANNKRQYRQQK